MAYGHYFVDVEVSEVFFRVREAFRTVGGTVIYVTVDNGYVLLAGPDGIRPFLTLLDDPKSTNPDGIRPFLTLCVTQIDGFPMMT